MRSARMSKFLPLQVAAVCYRRRGADLEFLLVNTTSGDRWTFPKGATAPRLSQSQAAEREALEEAGVVGVIEPQHFHLYLQPKGVLHKGAQESVVKAFLLEVTHTRRPDEAERNPTWFSVDDARRALTTGREVKYAAELTAVIDRAVEHLSTEVSLVPDQRPVRAYRIWRSLVKVLTFGLVKLRNL